MMDKNVIAPSEWDKYLSEFSSRNRGRRARFEAFTRDGVTGEDEEAVFDRISIDGEIVTVSRAVKTDSNDVPISNEITGVHGIAVQLDSDGSDNTIEFMDLRGDLTVLHFESMVDGAS